MMKVDRFSYLKRKCNFLTLGVALILGASDSRQQIIDNLKDKESYILASVLGTKTNLLRFNVIFFNINKIPVSDNCNFLYHIFDVQ